MGILDLRLGKLCVGHKPLVVQSPSNNSFVGVGKHFDINRMAKVLGQQKTGCMILPKTFTSPILRPMSCGKAFFELYLSAWTGIAISLKIFLQLKQESTYTHADHNWRIQRASARAGQGR